MLADRQTDAQTDRQTDRNTPLPYLGRVSNNKEVNEVVGFWSPTNVVSLKQRALVPDRILGTTQLVPVSYTHLTLPTKRIV